MKIALQISQILVYYDCPQVFVAEDIVGTKYLCLLVSCEDSISKHICTKISDKRLLKFVLGDLDLRLIFEEPEIPEYYTFDNLEESINADLYLKKQLPEEFLPQTGFTYKNDSLIFIQMAGRQSRV